MPRLRFLRQERLLISLIPLSVLVGIILTCYPFFHKINEILQTGVVGNRTYRDIKPRSVKEN